jgi:hypothetical protein
MTGTRFFVLTPRQGYTESCCAEYHESNLQEFLELAVRRVAEGYMGADAEELIHDDFVLKSPDFFNEFLDSFNGGIPY